MVICLTVDFFLLKLSKGSTLLIVKICEHCTFLTVFNGIYTIFTSNNSIVAVGKHYISYILGKVNTISTSNNSVVAVGKHLCGSATGKTS